MSPVPEKDTLQHVSTLIRAGNVIVLTGAGISVDSGIPDFRSPGGLWERYPIEDYGTIRAFKRDPAKAWEMFGELGGLLKKAKPNPGHLALSRLEEAGFVRAVITQNVDGLHQIAGSKTVIEFHGSWGRLVCIACGSEYPLSERPIPDEPGRVPHCSCGNPLKPDVVLFDEMISPSAIRSASDAVDSARVCLVCGTSATVYPAAGLPLRAKSRGATVVEVNLKPTALTTMTTDIFLEGPTSEILPELAWLALDPD